MSEIKVTGLAELNEFLTKLPVKMETNVLRGAIRAGLTEFKKEVLSTDFPIAPPNEKNKKDYGGYAGALKDSVKISGKIDKKNGKIVGKLTAGGKTKKGAIVYYARFVEFGTRPHSVSPGGKGQTNHPGAIAKPFMRPAFDKKSNAAIVAAGEYIKKRLDVKNGIDTKDVDIMIEK